VAQLPQRNHYDPHRVGDINGGHRSSSSARLLLVGTLASPQVLPSSSIRSALPFGTTGRHVRRCVAFRSSLLSATLPVMRKAHVHRDGALPHPVVTRRKMMTYAHHRDAQPMVRKLRGRRDMETWWRSCSLCSLCFDVYNLEDIRDKY
jgi:hypothetical protein